MSLRFWRLVYRCLSRLRDWVYRTRIQPRSTPTRIEEAERTFYLVAETPATEEEKVRGIVGHKVYSSISER